MVTPTPEQIIFELAQIVADLRCQRKASDAVAIATASMLLSIYPQRETLIEGIREVSHRSIAAAQQADISTKTIDLLWLRADQYVDERLDAIAATMRLMRANDQPR